MATAKKSPKIAVKLKKDYPQKFIEYLPVDQLHYDPQNPRLPHSIVNGANDSDVIDWMLKDASILELMGSIGLKDFFAAEPLLVVKDGNNSYYVVEGNRRLTAVKLLLHPSLAKRRSKAVLEIAREAVIKPQFIPAIIYETREEILDYLGFKHITGVKPWPALAKAKYLKQLQPEYKGLKINEQYRALAKAIGSRSDYVKDLLTTLDLYDKMAAKKFFNIKGLKEDTIDFGVYYNAMRYANISKYIGVNHSYADPNSDVDLKKLKELATWISEEDENRVTRLGESRNLGLLNQIIEHPKSLELFKSGRSIEDSAMFTGEPEELIKKAINESLLQIEFANSNSELMKNPNLSEIDALKSIAQISEQLANSFNNLLTKKGKKK